MTHRKPLADPRANGAPQRSVPRPAALALAALLAAPVVGGATAPTTGPAAGATPVDWDQRITASLLQTGGVDAVAADLSRAAEKPDVQRARVRAAIEAGDLNTAATELQRRAAAVDVDALRRLAAVQEMLGQTPEAERSLTAALAASPDARSNRELTLRLAALLFDDGRAEQGVAALDQLVKADPSAATAAGLVAYLSGQWDAAARHLRAGGQAGPAVGVRLLQGTAAMKANRTDAALAAFTAAADEAVKPHDRLYAQERVIAAARQAGTLPGLADGWLAQPDLPAGRMLPLATVLRELDRVPELLKWWRSAAADPARSATVLSDRFVREVLGAAQSAGLADDALGICQDMLRRAPDHRQWLTATARALLDQGKPADADGLLTARLNAVADQPAELQSLGRLARSLGRDGVALDAGKRLAAFGGDAAIAGTLLSASVYQAAGDGPRTAATLRQAAAAAEQHPAAAGEVVNALEAAGLQGDALRLLNAAAARDPDDEAALGRLASLLLDQHRPAEAVPVLERLSRSTSASGAVRAQADRQLLSAAADAGTVPDLIARTKDRLDHGHGDEQDLSLLVDAQVRVRNLDAAAEAIRTSHLLDEPARLRRLSVLFLRAKDFTRAAPALKRLVDLDPANATETLERLASVDVTLGDTGAATAAIDRLAARAGAGPGSISLMGGVMDRLGRPAEAARYYRRALAVNPTDGDTWLLWATAMSKAGRAAAARQRLQVLADGAATDNLFAVAVDGLLNLNGAPPALRAARRAAVVRAADRPDRTVLYHVMADLSDELKDPAGQVRAAEVTVAISDEERPERLRELMDVASQKGLVDTAADCGESLLGLGDEFPPQLFLQLGEQLLIGGRPQDAMRAFSRASEVADPDEVARRGGALLDQYGYPAAAAVLLTPLAGRQPGDAALAGTLARLDELAGRDDPGFVHYLAAVRAALVDLPSDPDPDAAPARVGVRGGALFARPRPPAVAAFSRLVAGAIATGRSADRRAALVDLLQSRLRDRLAGLAGSAGPTLDVTSIAAALRAVGFATNHPELADAADDAVIARWPADRAYAAQAVSHRLQNQLVVQGVRFAAAHDVEPTVALAMARQVVAPMPGVTTGPAATRPLATSLERAAEVLPALVVRGELDAARRVLASIPPDRPNLGAGSRQGVMMAGQVVPPVQSVVTAAAAVGDSEAVTRWALLWLDAVEPADTSAATAQPSGLVSSTVGTRVAGRVATGGRRPSQTSGYLSAQRWYVPLIGGTWRLLSPDGRAQFVDRLAQQAGRAKDRGARAALAGYVLQLSADLAGGRPDAARLAVDSLSEGATFDLIAKSAGAFLLVPAAERPELLPQLCRSIPKTDQLSFLLAIVAQSSEPLDAATADTISRTAGQLPTGQSVDWTEWFDNGAQQPLLAPLADAVLRCGATPDNPVWPDPAGLTAAAAAYATAGDPQRADDTAVKAIGAILASRPVDPAASTSDPRLMRPRRAFPPDRFTLLRIAVAAMSTDGRARLLAQHGAGAPPADGDPAESIARAALLDAVGRRSAALGVFRAAFARNPADTDLLRQYAERLQDDGRAAELVDTVGPRVGGNDMSLYAVRTGVKRSLRDLFRGRELHGDAQGQTAGPDLATAIAAGDVTAVATAFRGVLQAMRSPSAVPPAPAPDAGGLRGGSGSADNQPPAALDGFARWPGGLDAALQALQTPADASAGRFASSSLDGTGWLATLVARSAGDVDVRRRIVDHLGAAAAAGTLSRGDRFLVMNLAAVPGIDVPRDLLDALLPAAIMDDAGTEDRRLADALAAQHDPLADGVARWADALHRSSLYPARAGSAPVEPSPTTPVDDASVAGWLSTAFAADPAGGERALAALRADGRVTPRHSHCELRWVRLAAERGDLDAFRSRLAVAVRALAWQRVVPLPGISFAAVASVPPVLSEALPETVADPARRAALLEAATRALSAVAARWPDDTGVVRAFAAIGQWADGQGDRPEARALLDRADDLAERQGAGEHQLWVADLARTIGDDALADKLELGLLAEHCLPAVRIAPLLRRLQQQGHADVARRLASEAAMYCREPNVLALAGRGEARP